MSEPEFVKILVRFEKAEVEALDKAVARYAPGLDASRTSAIREAVRRYTQELNSREEKK